MTGVLRRVARAVALTPAVLLVTAAGPALAEAPQQWQKSPSVPPLHFLLVIFVIPAGLFIVITLLVLLPSMIRGQKYEPGLAWRNEPEWFGGPRGGVETADKTAPEAVEGGNRGGASAHW